MLPNKRTSDNSKWLNSPKAERTFAKRNGMPKREFVPEISDFDDDPSEDELLLDSLFDQMQDEDYWHERRMGTYL